MKVVALLPARLNSSRIKKKCLKKLRGIPLIIHTLYRSSQIRNLDEIYVCTDSKEIKALVEKYNFRAFMTSKKHVNGTERISEIAKKIKADLFIDIHSDEALLEPKSVEELIRFHKKNMKFDIIVPHKKSKIDGGINVVKLITNKLNEVIYFTRLACPYGFRKKNKIFYHHVDTISFKPKVLRKFSSLKIGNLEKIEGIELLRAIENKITVGTYDAKTNSFSINTPEDFRQAEKILFKYKIFKKFFEKF